ncbi:hypothetical protein L198_06601 [Cryptococcus wingfieldii CBS 7118]|uniref:Uncharacterized protein n=1 Tax=Cryptococcus wingfieldii CBS 7118 TaxID=1295528 RepID=A0A1E3IJL7_9TREE|nr:hypothetical protein L198_06601 [Cryptococcus wingfieldii CBS 7118]ODN88799.1 hypothetical protein L198_06601 [Cryptococcus wingfieldii CBS 7118]
MAFRLADLKLRRRGSTLRLLSAILAAITLYLIFFSHHDLICPLAQGDVRPSYPPRRPYPLDLPPQEVYMTFLSSGDIPEYFTSTCVLLYSLRYSVTTRDQARPFFVHVTELTPPEWIEKLYSLGASIVHTPLVQGLPERPTERRYKDMYTKLAMWNMTQFSRILFLDADHIVLKSLEGIWDDPTSRAENGVAALGAGKRGYMPEYGYFSAGFMMVRPNEDLFGDMLGTREFNPQWREQALLNKYFVHSGRRPWGRLDGKYQRIQPTYEHVEDGIHALHEKVWEEGIDERIRALWFETLEEAEQFFEENEGTEVESWELIIR